MAFQFRAISYFTFVSLYILIEERYDLVNAKHILSLISNMRLGSRPMIKKWFSKALLLVVMDKRARTKFKTVRARNRRLNNIGQSINQLYTNSKGGGMAKENKTPINERRKALIEDAMAMRKEKLHIVGQLDQERLRKLGIMVGKAFDQSAAE